MILILGATGFVGRNLIEVFEGQSMGYERASKSLGVDLRSYSETKELLQKIRPTSIINCAAHVGSLNYVTEKAANVISDNAQMSISLYRAIAEVCPQAVVISPIANCAYPASATTYFENDWLNGEVHRSVLSFGTSRRFLWGVSQCFYMQHGIRTISLLVPNMYGPYDSTDPNKAHALNALAAKFVKAQRENTSCIDVWGTGIAIREWLYAKDFARLVAEIVTNPNKLGLDEPLNVAQNFGLSVRELTSLIKESVGFGGVVRFDPSRPDGAPKKVMDDNRFKKVFPSFSFTALGEGIKQTVEHYKAIYPY